MLFLKLGNIFNTESPIHPTYSVLFLYKQGGNFEFENIEDKFNGYMSCITHFVVLHTYLKGSKILLKLSRHQIMMGGVIFIALLPRSCMQRALCHKAKQ